MKSRRLSIEGHFSTMMRCGVGRFGNMHDTNRSMTVVISRILSTNCLNATNCGSCFTWVQALLSAAVDDVGEHSKEMQVISTALFELFSNPSNTDNLSLSNKLSRTAYCNIIRSLCLMFSAVPGYCQFCKSMRCGENLALHESSSKHLVQYIYYGTMHVQIRDALCRMSHGHSQIVAHNLAKVVAGAVCDT